MNKVSLEQVEQVLTGTQCGECQYNGCRPYAAAVLRGEAATDRCRPGGEVVAHELAELLGTPYLPPRKVPDAEQVAQVRADDCIGCTLCIQACPTDAIVGRPKQLHAVIETDCTGCGLCLPKCPVDCIELIAAPVDSVAHDAANKRERIWQLVNAKTARDFGGRNTLPALELNISPEQEAKIAAARAQSKAKYSRS